MWLLCVLFQPVPRIMPMCSYVCIVPFFVVFVSLHLSLAPGIEGQRPASLANASVSKKREKQRSNASTERMATEGSV